MLSVEDVEEHVMEVTNLHKQLAESIGAAEHTRHKKETEHVDEVKKLIEHHTFILDEERGKYDSLRNESDKRVRELLATMSAKETDTVKMTTELENRYFHCHT